MAWAALQDRMIRNVRDRFATAGTYTLQGGASSDVSVVFDRAYTEQAFDDGIAVTVTRPVAMVVDADLSRAPRPGDSLQIGTTTYTVEDVQAEGCGSSRCYLTED